MGITGFMSPGIGIVKSWQGITEIVLRAVAILLALIMAGSGGGCQTAVGELPAANLAIQGLTDSAGGWLIFMGIVVIIYEVVFIVQRFLGINIINQHITIVIIVDVVFNFVCALLIFAAAVALASYIPQWQAILSGDPFTDPIVNRVTAAAGTATATGFITLILLIGLGVFMILGGFVLNWGPTKAKYAVSSGGGGGGE